MPIKINTFVILKFLVMNLAARKYNFIQELTTIDESLLEKLEIILKTSKKDWFIDLNTEEKLEIEIGLKQAENDEFISHKTVMNKFAKWH
jgi:predicted transcriptional regulator